MRFDLLDLSILLNIMFHAPMGRFQLELFTFIFHRRLSYYIDVSVLQAFRCHNNTRFKEHRKDFRYAEGKSKFSEHVLNEGHEMKTIEETMSIIHLENNHRKINTLGDIKILKAASSKYLLKDVIAGQNHPIYKIHPTSVI